MSARIPVIVQVLLQFNEYEIAFYKSLSTFDKSAYCSYIGNHKYQRITKPLMTPTEWFETRSIPTDLETIGQALGISRGAVSAYLTSGIRRIRRIIAKDPERYKDLIEYRSIEWQHTAQQR